MNPALQDFIRLFAEIVADELLAGQRAEILASPPSPAAREQTAPRNSNSKGMCDGVGLSV
jgi:hypothetical protein